MLYYYSAYKNEKPALADHHFDSDVSDFNKKQVLTKKIIIEKD